MVVLFVILTILFFLTIDFIVQKARKLHEKAERMKYRKPVLPRAFENEPQHAASYWTKLDTQKDEGISARQP